MDYMRYHRYITLLDGENREFALHENSCKGNLKVETGNNKGALRCRVENLRPMQKNDYAYKLIFFGKKREKTIYAIIGNLNINRNGSGETYFRFNPTDVDGDGHCYDDFSSIIVAASSLRNDKEPLHPVLSGETGNQGEEERGGGQESSDFFSEEQGVTERPPTGEMKKTYNHFYHEHVRRNCEHMCQVADFYEPLHPFEQDLLEAKWRKVENIHSMPIVSPGAIYFSGQYKHYLFGATENDQGYAARYYVAVPGRFLKRERPDGGASGFTYWQAIKGAKNENGAYGYWIVAIDPFTGDIMDAHEEKGMEKR